MLKIQRCLGVVLLLTSSYTNAIVYDHLDSDSEGKSYDLNVASNEYIKLDVLNTCEDTDINWFKVSGSEVNNRLTANGAPEEAIPVIKASCDFVNEKVKSKLTEFSKKPGMCVLTEKKSVLIPNEPGITGFVVELDVPGNAKTVNAVSPAQIKELEISLSKTAGDFCTSELTKLVQASSGKFTLGAIVTDETLRTKIAQLQDKVSKNIDEELKKFKPATLADTRLVINTGVKGWTTDFSGGILVSGLTSKKFRVDNTDSDIQFVRSKAAEDKQRLELGAFTHVYHADWTNSVFKTGTPAITAGISVNNGDKLDYFAGISLKFGAAYLNVGSHWGQVSTGPTKYPINTALSIDEATAIAALEASSEQTRTEQSFFVSVSFSFAGQGAAPVKSALAFPTPKKTSAPKN